MIRWAAPAVTCGLLLLALLNPGRQPAAPGQPLVALILSNQTLVAGLSNDLPAGQVGGSFGWTNSGSSTSSISSFSPLRAN